jgi:hypothetical protein
MTEIAGKLGDILSFLTGIFGKYFLVSEQARLRAET